MDYLHTARLRQCTPVNSDSSVSAQPLLGLSSGYIARAQAEFPKQGSRYPWQVKQSYLADYRALKLKGIQDEAMQFSNPGVFGGRTHAAPSVLEADVADGSSTVGAVEAADAADESVSA